MKTSKILLSIIIPVRNEEINIKIMLKILKSILEVSHEIIVVYDQPDDKTIPVVTKLRRNYSQIFLVKNYYGTGVANAIRSGIKASDGEYILIFTADEVGPVLAIEDMIALMKQGADFVSCTRYALGGRRLGGSVVEGLLSRIGNRIFHLLIGSTLTDSTTGIKMFKKKIFKKVNLESRVGWAVIFEMTIKVQMLGLRLGEVPIISIDRLYGGESSFRLIPWLREYLKWFFYGVKNLHNSGSRKPVMRIIPRSTGV